MSEDKEITDVQPAAETTAVTPPTVNEVNTIVTEDEKPIEKNIEIVKNDEDENVKDLATATDTLGVEVEDIIKNKELKSLMQLTKEANLDTNIKYKRTSQTPDSLEIKRAMRSVSLEHTVKAKATQGQSPNTHEKDEKGDKEEGGGKKRKRDSSSETLIGGAIGGQNKELLKPAMELVEKNKDGFCWKCHRDGVSITCTTCPRSYHTKCIKNIVSIEHWICPECSSILTAENIKTRSPALKDMPLGHLCKLLKFALKRMVQINDSEPFVSPVNEMEFPDYRNYIVQPMDFTMLEKNIKANAYGSTKAFEADAKWLLHNSIIFNSSQSKLTTVAKSIIKICKQEMIEIENCPTCYLNANTKKSWFVEVCPKPHLLVWAKLKGFPYWPAKIMCTNSQGSVDVRFFGAHDKAWVSVKDCYLYSVKDPNATHHKRDEISECVKEVEMYIRNLKSIYGKFNYPPYRTPYNPEHHLEQLQMFLPNYKSENKGEPEIPSFNTSVQEKSETGADEEDWEVRKYIEEGRNTKSPSPEVSTKRVSRKSVSPKKPTKTPSSEEIPVPKKMSRRSSLQSNSSRISNISDKVTKMEIESEDGDKMEEKKVEEVNKETGKVKISDKLIKKLAPSEPDKIVINFPERKEKETGSEKEKETSFADIKHIILGNDESDLGKVKSEINKNNDKLKTYGKKNIKIIKEEPKLNLNETTKFKINIAPRKPKKPAIICKQITKNLLPRKEINKKINKIEVIHLKSSNFPDEENSLLEEMYTVDAHADNPIITKSKTINGTPKRKRDPHIPELSSPIESKLLKLVDVDLIKNPKLHPLDIPGHTPPTPILSKDKDTTLTLNPFDDVGIKCEIESEDELSNDYDSPTILPVNKANPNKTVVGKEKPASLLKNPINITQKTPQTSLLKAKQTLRSTPNSFSNENSSPSLNNSSKVTTTPGIDSGGVVLYAQPKTYLNNQLVLPPNQSITYGGNSIFVQHPQFSNYLIPTSALNVGTISLPISSKSNHEVTSSIISQSQTTPTLTILSKSNQVTNTLKTVTPNCKSSTSATTSLNTQNKPLPPLCRTQVSLSSQITLTAIANTTNSVPGSVPPPLCSLTTATTTTSLTSQVVSVSSANSAISGTSTNQGNPTQSNTNQGENLEDYSYLSGYVPEKLMKALTEVTHRPPPPLLTPKPQETIVATVSQKIANSTGPIAMKINSLTHKLTDYFRETIINFLTEFSTNESADAEVALLKLEIENLKSQHNLEILEMKQNLQTILKEVHKNFTDERQRVIEETRRACELDAIKRIDEAKSKQWCAVCGKEALFYCCWNTSYCDYPCQGKHWPTHMDKCTQDINKGEKGESGNSKQNVKKGGLSKVTLSENNTSANKAPKVYSNPKITGQNKSGMNLTKVITCVNQPVSSTGLIVTEKGELIRTGSTISVSGKLFKGSECSKVFLSSKRKVGTTSPS